MNELALFAGTGGGILGGKLLGWRTVCAVERDAYAASILAQRQNDGILEPFPIWSDVRSFSGYPWRGIIDIVSGGFPCQDISLANRDAKGISGERSGLWKEMFRIVCEVRPRYVFVENSPALTSRGIGCVLGDLASVGFDAEWDVFGAHHVCAPHKRDRIWILAYTRRQYGDPRPIQGMEPKQQEPKGQKSKHFCQVFSYPASERLQAVGLSIRENSKKSMPCKSGWWEAEPNVGRVANGVAFGMDRLRAIGNGQVPSVAAIAFTILKERICT